MGWEWRESGLKNRLKTGRKEPGKNVEIKGFANRLLCVLPNVLTDASLNTMASRKTRIAERLKVQLRTAASTTPRDRARVAGKRITMVCAGCAFA
jgi:hypothetical protein